MSTDLLAMDKHFGGAVSTRLGAGILLTPVRYGSFTGFLFWLLGQWAVTWKGVIHVTVSAPAAGSEASYALLAHECYHVWQQQRMGWWKFLAHYAAELVRGWLHRRNIRFHPLEKPAYEFVESLQGEAGMNSKEATESTGG